MNFPEISNESAFGVFVFAWTYEGTIHKIMWESGMGEPGFIVNNSMKPITNPSRFGWKEPRTASEMKPFVVAFIQAALEEHR